MDEKVMQKLSYGLFILTAREGEKDNGCIINTVTQVANSPNRISIAVNKSNYTCGMIEKTGQFNVSVLSEQARFETFQHYGFQSGRDTDKMAKIAFRRAENGIALIDTQETCAYLSAKVFQSIDVGSHRLFLADVTDGEWLTDTPPVTYAYYFSHIKPKPAPKTEKKTGWICTICGYIYEGEVLPSDFICPVCKHPASDFKKLD